jgi:hypothetical protein
MCSPVDSLIGATDTALQSGACYRTQQFEREQSPFSLERNLIDIVKALIGSSVLGFPVHNNPTVLGPVGNYTAHIISCNLAWLSGTVPVGPTLFVYLVSDFFETKIARCIQV